MEIDFRLAWLAPGAAPRKAFKQSAAQELFSEYLKRISRFFPCTAKGTLARSEAQSNEVHTWLCDPRGRALTSDEVAEVLERFLGGGLRRLEIWVGGPDGFRKKELDRLEPDLRWSFGPLTFPHELAAVVAAEQFYRALTILKRQPYHVGH